MINPDLLDLDLEEICSKLNEGQQHLLNFIMQYALECKLVKKKNELPPKPFQIFYFFLSVGAGAGKSYLVIAIIKYLKRLLRYPNQTLDQPFVLWLHLLKKLLQVLNSITLHFTFHPPVKSGLKPYGSKKQMPVFKSFDHWWNINDRKGNLWIFIKI